MSTAADELRAAVETAVAGTPYRVERTAEGFRLRIDVDDERWHELLSAAGRRRVAECYVRLDEHRRTMQITEAQFHVRWAVGLGGRTPRLVAAAQATAMWGRTWSVSRTWTWRPGQLPQAKPVVERRLSSAHARRLMKEAGAALGWSERMGVHERIGLVAACAGLATLVAMALLLLTGR